MCYFHSTTVCDKSREPYTILESSAFLLPYWQLKCVYLKNKKKTTTKKPQKKRNLQGSQIKQLSLYQEHTKIDVAQISKYLFHLLRFYVKNVTFFQNMENWCFYSK